jgi:hypothetical protein
MTMPEERARALRYVGEILREMRSRPDVPDDLRQQARLTLRHDAEPRDLERMIPDVDRMPLEFPNQHWLAPEV